jgi:GxxExxY protein
LVRDLSVTRQPGIPVVYEADRIRAGLSADLEVEDQAIVEIKAMGTIAPVHRKQLQRPLRSDRERHRSHRQRAQRTISRKIAKVAK